MFYSQRQWLPYLLYCFILPISYDYLLLPFFFFYIFIYPSQRLERFTSCFNYFMLSLSLKKKTYSSIKINNETPKVICHLSIISQFKKLFQLKKILMKRYCWLLIAGKRNISFLFPSLPILWQYEIFKPDCWYLFFLFYRILFRNVDIRIRFYNDIYFFYQTAILEILTWLNFQQGEYILNNFLLKF